METASKFLDLLFSCLLITFFVFQYLITKKWGMPVNKKKNAFILFSILLIETLLIVNYYTASTKTMFYDLLDASKILAIVIMLLWFCLNIHKIISLVEKKQ